MRHLYSLWRISLTLVGVVLVGLFLGAGRGREAPAAAASPAGATASPTPSPTPTRLPRACTSITGSITSNDRTQVGGLNSNGPTSVCMYWPGCPGTVDSQFRHYDVYRFVNLTSLYTCITIQLDAPACTGANAVVSAAYYTFDPAHICVSYQAGTATSPSGSYAFYIPCCARGAFDLVVAEANPGAGCGSYTVTVLSDSTCPSPPSPTPPPPNTPTPSRTPTATPTCITSVLDWRIVSAPSPGNGAAGLNGVATVAADDVWSVGYYIENSRRYTLIEHWDGQVWDIVPSPNSGSGDNLLTAVTALAPDDVWAVGSYVRGGGLWGALTEHWDGTAWSVVPSPMIASDILAAVTAVATNDVWAVGTTSDDPLALHWDGTAWVVVPTPAGGRASNALLGVTAVAANDVWAVGRYYDQARFWYQTLVLHWNGAAWSTVPSPNTAFGDSRFYAVTAVAANEVWAVGMGNGWTLTERWNGTAWSIVPSPNAGDNEHDLYGVAVGGPGDIWAVGRFRNAQAPYRTLLEHWNGSDWGVAPSPNIGPYDNILYGVAARTGTDIWAVGIGSGDTLILHYTAWPCGPVTPGPTRTPSPTRTITATPSGNATQTPTATLTASPSPTRTVPPGATIGTPTVPATPTACLVQFNDVPGTNPFYATIRCLACRGIVGGYPCGGPGEPCPGAYFRPNNNLTRGQVSKIVAESAGFADPVPSPQQTFADVPPGSTFWVWIERLAGRVIIGGYPCGGPFEPCVAPTNRPYFRPGNNVTRGQLSKITSGAAGWTETPTGQTFEDVPPGQTFYLWVERMAARGIINGYPCGGPFEPCVAPNNRPYLRPNNNATRGQISKIAVLTFFPTCAPP